MRQFHLTVLLTAALAPAVLFAQARSEDKSAASEQKPAAEQATDLAVQKGLEWIARQQCVNCHFKVPGKVESSAISLDGAFLYTARQGLLLTDKLAKCTRAADKKEQVTYLGVFLASVPDVVRRHVKLPAEMGLLVETVDLGSPAQAAGLKQHDVLLKIDEQLLVNPQQFTTVIRTFPADAEVRLEAIQQNEPRTLSARLVQRESAEREATDTAHALSVLALRDVYSHNTVRIWDTGTGKLLSASGASEQKQAEPAAAPPKKTITYLGVHTSPPSEALAKQLKLPPGLGLMIESVEENTAAAKAGLKPYDVLQKLDKQLLANTEQFTVLIRSHKPGDEVKLTLIREGKPQVVPVTLGKHEVESGPGEPLGAYWLDLDRSLAIDWKVNRNLAHWFDAVSKNEDATDAEFIRRVYLDLMGIPPQPDEVKSFLNDTSKDKRKQLVDSLLSRPEAIALASGSTAVKWSDPVHQLSFVTKDGARHLTVTGPEGKILFEGPVDTAEQRKSLPPEIASKLKVIVDAEANRSVQPVAAKDLLGRTLARLEFVEAPLAEAVQELRKLSGANLVVNWKALKQAGVSADEPITLSLRDVRLSTALSMLLSLAESEKGRLAYSVEGEAILISVKGK
jgi:serine protease Do